MIILYSTFVFENFRFWQIPKVNPSLKSRFPDQKIIITISFREEHFAQNWLPDVIFCLKKVSGEFRPEISLKVNFRPVTISEQKITSDNQFSARFCVWKPKYHDNFFVKKHNFQGGVTSGICQKRKFSKKDDD